MNRLRPDSSDVESVQKYKNFPEFRSQHWDDPNVLAHVRMSDRVGPNDEKLLHVEELQSDWGQEGRQLGFKGKDPLSAAERNEFNRLRIMPDHIKTPEEIQLEESFYKRAYGTASGPPVGPYVTNTQGWTDLALKRVMKEAAEGGYDGVVFTPGAEQAKRYPGMEEKAAQGLEKFYDNFVTTRAKELARQHDKEANLGKAEIPNTAPMAGISGEELLDWLPETRELSNAKKAQYWASLSNDERQQLFNRYFEENGTTKNITGFHMPMTDKMRQSILSGQKAFKKGGRINPASGNATKDEKMEQFGHKVKESKEINPLIDTALMLVSRKT
jgi:hypothetical protein